MRIKKKTISETFFLLLSSVKGWLAHRFDKEYYGSHKIKIEAT